MIDKTVIPFISTGIPRSIKEYLPLEQRSLLLDILYFLSIKTERAQFCTDKDIETIKKLYEFCKQLNIEPENYVSCAYDYISKYVSKGHKIPVSYLLSENIVSYCAKHVFSCSADGLIFNSVKSDVIMTEKQIRNFSKENNVSYMAAISTFFKLGRASDVFLLYKVYMGVEPFSSMNLSEDMGQLLKIVRPIFVQMTAKYGLYPANKITEWNNSKIECFKECQILFRDLYLNDEIPPQAQGNEATEIGSAVHAVFEDIIYKYMKAENKDIEKIYTRHLTCKPFLEAKNRIVEHLPGIKSFFTGADSTFQKYVNKDTQIYIEEKMYLTMPEYGITFCGTADLILINGDEAILIDYKTSKIEAQKWIDKNNEKYHKQLSLYAQFIKNTFKVSSVKAIVIYTRGLIHEYDSINDNILAERASDISLIKNAMKMNNFRANSSHCFLCRHPACKFRSRESIWNPDGSKKIKQDN